MAAVVAIADGTGGSAGGGEDQPCGGFGGVVGEVGQHAGVGVGGEHDVLTFTKRFGLPLWRKASIRFRVASAEFMKAPANDFSIPAAKCKTTATPSVALTQSSRDKRSPLTSSTFIVPGSSRMLSKRLRRLECRTKQRIFLNPYSRRICTTLVPIKPFAPVTRIRSSDEMIYILFTNPRMLRSRKVVAS